MAVNQKIRQIRLRKGMTLDSMAILCKLSKGYLSKLERAKRAPPVSTLETIAMALGVDLAELIEARPEDVSEQDGLEIVRADAGPASGKVLTQAGYSFRPLVRAFRNKQMFPFLMVIQKGETDTFSHDSEEFAFVVQGSLRFVYEGKDYELTAGDSFYLDSRAPHHFENLGNKPAIMVVVNFDYRRF